MMMNATTPTHSVVGHQPDIESSPLPTGYPLEQFESCRNDPYSYYVKRANRLSRGHTGSRTGRGI